MVLVVAAIGVSGSGKTTAIEYLIERFSEMGYRAGAVKHIHHKGFTIDTQGKNTWRFSQAGAKVVVAISPEEVTVIRKTERELSDLNRILGMLEEDRLDVAFVEGMHGSIAKRADIVKIVAAKDREELRSTLDGIAEPIIAITGLVAKTVEQQSFGDLPFVRIPEDGEKLVEQILRIIEKE